MRDFSVSQCGINCTEEKKQLVRFMKKKPGLFQGHSTATDLFSSPVTTSEVSLSLPLVELTQQQEIVQTKLAKSHTDNGLESLG